MITSLVYLVIYLIVVGLIIWLLTYLVDAIPLPEPFGRGAHRAARDRRADRDRPAFEFRGLDRTAPGSLIAACSRLP
jgi:hypothetical protein